MKYCLSMLLAAGLAAPAARGAELVDFETQILPIFAERCVGCHGPEKQQGRLRLDAGDQIAAFRKETLLVAGKPDESELLRRLTLPEDDNRRMPKGADPLPAEQVALIRTWIEQGAVLTAAAAVSPPAAETPTAEAEPFVPGEEDPELAKLPPTSAEAIAAIEAAGGSVMPLFGSSPLLQVSFARSAHPAGDEAVAALAGAAEQIVWLNLSKSQATAAGLAPLAKLTNLIRLNLEQSSVDDAGLAHVTELKRLEYLNVYETAVTDAGMAGLHGLPRLRRLYVWKTKVSYEAAQALQAAIAGLEVNLGWDHPAVVKARLTGELSTAQELAKTATERAADLERQFNAAREAQQHADDRVKQLQEQLEALETPAEESAEPAAEQAAAS
ncbi:MAG TPA: hypothetical protein PJ982_06080 [Lacipirellulaceae bacterium]|nr:hypothetical protein [Lacipirellulaceae bacterium]